MLSVSFQMTIIILMVMSNDSQIEGGRKVRYGMIFAVYLVGLLLGGLYIGMVIPARTVVQLGYGIDSATGIWMINVYTLFYAALIPTIGKLADRHGRKRVFIICVAIFGVGSVICGLSEHAGFTLLLAGRVAQAIGAGGMIPVANAEIGTAFPPERRGAALGIAAAVTGISNMLGAVAGSALLGLAGTDNWSVLFYVAVPFCIILIAGAVLVLPNHTGDARGKLDVQGSVLFTLFVLMLLLGIKDIDFFNFQSTFTLPQTWLPLLAAAVLVPLFFQVEKRAQDAIFNLGYLHNRQILITLIVSFFIGCTIISMTVIPEFAEFVLGLQAGEGGYYIAALGIFSIVGPPLAGRFIDRFGAKPVLMCGLVVMTGGYLMLTFFAAPLSTPMAMIIGLAIVGLGMGFAMGAPTNYMILENTEPKESTSAIATITLVRQIGTSLAPAILVGFISQGTGMLGFQQMLLCVVVFNVISIAVMIFYRE